MQTTPPGTSSANPDRPLSVAESYAANSNLTDEMIEPDGAIRPHWRPFVSMLDEMGSEEVLRRWEHARRLIHENGVTHNVYGDPQGLDRPWGLDLIPLLIAPEQWNYICEGLV